MAGDARQAEPPRQSWRRSTPCRVAVLGTATARHVLGAVVGGGRFLGGSERERREEGAFGFGDGTRRGSI